MLLRFKQLKERHIAENRCQLGNLIHNYGFPTGFLLSPNVRVRGEEEVEAWVEARRAAADSGVPLKGIAKRKHEAKSAQDAA